MKIIISFFIFCLVLFIYLHIVFHLKKSDELEIYEMEQVSKEKLEEICDVRQPVIFEFDCKDIMESTTKKFIEENYPAFEIKLRNTKDNTEKSEIYTPLPYQAAKKLFEEDKEGLYFSEKNQDFLQETAMIKHFQYNDEFLRPSMVSNCFYDVICGSEDVETPFRYEVNYRNYFVVTEGSVRIKMAPPKSGKYLHPNNDYEHFEFVSPVNPWSPQAQYKADFGKIKCLDFVLEKGKTVFIPAYWWYSLKLNRETSLSIFQYRTYMNNAAILPHIFMYALQNQNIKRETTKKLDIRVLKKHSKDDDCKIEKEKEPITETKML
jgi:hypothetical protein